MRTLDRYVMRRIWAPSLTALAVVCVLAVANEIHEWADRLPIDHIKATDFLQLGLLFVPALIVFVVPVMYLFGIMLAFGRLAANGEIVAMKAAGIPLKRIVAPVIIFGALLSVATFLIQDRVQPWALVRINHLVFNELPLRISLRVLPAGEMHDFRGWKVYLGSKEQGGNTFHNVDILRPTDQGPVVYSARSAQIEESENGTTLILNNCTVITPAEQGRQDRVRVRRLELPVPAFEPRPAPSRRQQFTLRQLLYAEEQLSGGNGESPSLDAHVELYKMRREIAERLSFPFACFAVSLVAAPLGVRARRSGRSYTFSVGGGIILLYYVLVALGQPASLHTLGTFVLRAWIANLVLMTAGLAALWRVDRI